MADQLLPVKRILVVFAVTTSMLSVGVALATPSSGFTRRLLGRATMTEEAKIELARNSDVIAYSLTIEPGGTSGWHKHPGDAIVLVKSGVVSFSEAHDDECTTRTFSAGQAFMEPSGAVHAARNESASTPVELLVTFFNVPTANAPSEDAPVPSSCGG